MKTKTTAPSFQEEQNLSHLTESHDLGVQVVEVADIIGSVNRWQDFDAAFRLVSKNTKRRYEGIKKAMEEGSILPPVSLYKVGDHYYVVDGNHRVAVAKEIGQHYMDAEVIEHLPPRDTKEHILWRERSRFERQTGLHHIELTDLGHYTKLLQQIHEFKKEEERHTGEILSLKEASLHWYQEIYEKVCLVIQKENLLAEFPKRTLGDLFFYASYHKIAKERLLNEKIGFREALQDFHHQAQKTLGEKIIDAVSSLLGRPYPQRTSCYYGLIFDEEGLAHPTRDCRHCKDCKEKKRDLSNISYDELEDYTSLKGIL